MSTEASASGSRPPKAATSNVSVTPERLTNVQACARAIDLRLCDVEAARGDRGEAERVRARDQPAQPGAGAATGVEQADRTCAGCAQVSLLRLQQFPDLAVRIGVQAVKGQKLR